MTRSGPLGSATSRNRTTSNAAGSRNSSLVEVFSGCASLSVAKLSAGFALSRRVNKQLEKAYTGAPEPLALPVATSPVGAEPVSAEQPPRGALSAALPARRSCAGRGCSACCVLLQPPPSRLLRPEHCLQLVATVPSTFCSTAVCGYLQEFSAH